MKKIKVGIAGLGRIAHMGHFKELLALPEKFEITAVCDRPLVLHGGSGIPDEDIQAAIKAGIRKVNFGTDVCFAFLDEVFATSRETYAIDLFMKNAVQNVKKFAVEKIKLLGAENKA